MYDQPLADNYQPTNIGKIKIVILPHWLLSMLDAYGKPLTTAVNVKELLDILLVEDVAKYMYLNNRLLNCNNQIITAVRNTFDCYFMSMYSSFISPIEDDKLRSQIEDKIRILPVLMQSNPNSMLNDELGRLDSEIDPTFLKEWKLWEVANLFDGSADAVKLKQYKASRGFELVYIDEHHMGLKLVEGNPQIDPDTLLVKNLDNCMDVMNQYYDFTDVSRTALFDLFMQYTSKQTLSI